MRPGCSDDVVDDDEDDEDDAGAVLTMASDAAVMDSSEAGAINLRTNSKNEVKAHKNEK